MSALSQSTTQDSEITNQSEIKSSDVNPGWTSAAACPGSSNEEIVVLNNGEFLAFQEVDEYTHVNDVIYKYKKHVIYKYNIHHDEWTQYLKLPDYAVHERTDGGESDEGQFTMQVDCDHNRLFLVYSGTVVDERSWNFEGFEALKTAVVDIQSGELIHESDKRAREEMEPFVAIIHVNGIMHKVGGDHRIWSEKKRDWEPIKARPKFMDFYSVSDVTLIHVPSKDFLLMIGGEDVGDHDWRVGVSTGIWRYSLKSGLWKQMKDEQNNNFVFDSGKQRAVLSSDEQHVIIAPTDWFEGGRTHFQVMDIRDDDTYKLWESSITVPYFDELGSHVFDSMMISGDSGGSSQAQALISGWIRRQFVSKQGGTKALPLVIMKLISQRCSLEMVHYFGHDGDNVQSHLMKPLADILYPKLGSGDVVRLHTEI